MSRKKVLVILGHPSEASFCAALASTYAQAATRAGHEVRELRLGAMAFDPVLHAAYTVRQALEPELQQAQVAITWADHLCWVYPIWWGSVPALLKGFLDRVLLPGFAFQYEAGSSIPKKLLKGRSAQMLVCMDTPPWYFRWFQHAPGVHQMKIATLEFCGIRPVGVQVFGPVLGSSAARRSKWLQRVDVLASRLS